MVPVRLRGHHFLCVLTYRGYGYTPAFVANMSRVVAAIKAGAAVELTEGPDDICNGFTSACREISDHDCSLASTMEMDRTAIASVARLLPDIADKSSAIVLTAERVEALRVAFASGDNRQACKDCSWAEFCTAIAADGFSGTKL
ncbi:DUF1284 domain-containing protein [Rhizobium sp. G21]|uniref:DUF1284 domain-containing protein n=1 Tax=Rhizobium sp. G21 TaxID=2758439 RepID=UPI001FEFA6B8|nr:DUF1284 domain-containing protein [Rhizobium sp. G21]